MVLTIGAWFNEPGISFEFSYKVDNYIRERIKEYVMQPIGLIDLDKELFLSITIATIESQEELEVRFGRLTKTSKTYQIGFWFPYKKIINAEHPLKEYLENYVIATKILFEKWNVTQEQIDKFKDDIFNEILNNDEYIKVEED